jgi:hypothetical protein
MGILALAIVITAFLLILFVDRGCWLAFDAVMVLACGADFMTYARSIHRGAQV